MLLFSIIFDTGSFMPKKALPTGNDYLNIIEFIRYMFSNNLSNLGLLIMTMVGFASYMTHIGANDAFVNIAIKPLSLIKSPYALVFLAFLLGKAVSMVITSAVGLGVLCLALMGPALAALGMNKKTIAAVFVTSGAASMVLLGGSTAASAKACELTILDYVFIYKISAALPTVFVMGIAHVFWQRYLDRKEGWVPSEHVGEKLVFEGEDVKRPSTAAPKIFAVLPFLPMVFVVVFSQYCIDSIKLNITTLMLFCVTIAMICEAIRWRGNIDKLGVQGPRHDRRHREPRFERWRGRPRHVDSLCRHHDARDDHRWFERRLVLSARRDGAAYRQEHGRQSRDARSADAPGFDHCASAFSGGRRRRCDRCHVQDESA